MAPVGTDSATGMYVPSMASLQVIVPINTKEQFRTSSTPGIHFHLIGSGPGANWK